MLPSLFSSLPASPSFFSPYSLAHLSALSLSWSRSYHGAPKDLQRRPPRAASSHRHPTRQALRSAAGSGLFLGVPHQLEPRAASSSSAVGVPCTSATLHKYSDARKTSARPFLRSSEDATALTHRAGRHASAVSSTAQLQRQGQPTLAVAVDMGWAHLVSLPAACLLA